MANGDGDRAEPQSHHMFFRAGNKDFNRAERENVIVMKTFSPLLEPWAAQITFFALSRLNLLKLLLSYLTKS